MKKIILLIFPLTVIFIFSSCSTTQETAKTETPKKETTVKDSVYVFDEVPPDTTVVVKHAQEPAVIKGMPTDLEKYFIVQIGAFTTKEKAESFAEKSRKELNREVIVIYSNQVNLFVVQLTTLFPLRDGAEKVRNELWKMNDYKDAWIQTVTK